MKVNRISNNYWFESRSNFSDGETPFSKRSQMNTKQKIQSMVGTQDSSTLKTVETKTGLSVNQMVKHYVKIWANVSEKVQNIADFEINEKFCQKNQRLKYK